MAQSGIKGVRAAFADATAKAVSTSPKDPAPEEKRGGYDAGAWPGAPSDQLPPGCPVIPLGIDGKTTFFIDTVGQLLPVATSEWGKKMLLQLFCTQPNFVAWAWPRWSEPSEKKKKPSVINGVDVDEATGCLLKAAGTKGPFDPANKVRGRGAWSDRHGRLIWHSGNALWVVENGKLKSSAPGEIDGMFYPRRASIAEPWREPVTPADGPARALVELLRSWNWERGNLDAILLLGWKCVAIVGGALRWRPHVAATGDARVGKSYLSALFKGVLDDMLIDVGGTTEAGVRQHMGLDSLPVAIDEFEASDDNRRVMAVLELVRAASSGARILRGGQDHKGVEFQARNAFFCSGINLPPMRPQDKSRFAVLNLNKLKLDGKPPPVVGEQWGRMLLRQLMDAWPQWERTLADWRAALGSSGLDGRAQDTYGTLLAMAELVLGPEALEELGLPVTEAGKIGELIASATAEERATQLDNWRACLEHLLTMPVDAWKGGEKPSIGGIIEQLEAVPQEIELKFARPRLAAAGVGIVEEPDPDLPAGRRRYLLAVPVSSPALAQLFRGTRWSDGGWAGALKQGRAEGVVRQAPKVVKIERAPAHCLLVDFKAYDKLTGGAP